MGRLLNIWAVFLLPFISLSPIFDFTLPGSAARGVTILLLAYFFFSRLNTSLRNLSAIERLFFLYMGGIGMVSTIAGLLAGRYADPAMMAKFFILQLMIYFVAISINSVEQIRTILRLYYLFCLAAAIQSILAGGAEILGIRQFGEIPINDGRAEYYYNLSWFGLLGGDIDNGRTNFYFSESTHFAHFLMPGIAYSLGTGRRWGLITLLLGFAASFSGIATGALLLMLLMWVLRGRDITTLIFSVAFFVIAGVLLNSYLGMDDEISLRLFQRESSAVDKILTYYTAAMELEKNPLGVGVFNSSEYFGESINTSGGVFNWLVWFGWLGVPAILAMLWSILRCGFSHKDQPLLTAMGIGLFCLSLGTFSHGPLPKYFMIFFFGLLFRHRALIRAETRTRKATTLATPIPV